MTKMQKTWAWIFGGMFIVPEVLWSPIGNFYYEFLQSSYTNNVQSFRNNFLQNPDNLQSLRFVIFLQFIGLLLFFIFTIRDIKNKDRKVIKYFLIGIPTFLILILTAFAFYSAIFLNIQIL